MIKKFIQKAFYKNGEFTISGFTFTNIIILVFLMGAVLSPFAGTCGRGPEFVDAKTDNPLAKSKNVQGAMVVQQALREIYKEVNPAVVRIETEQEIRITANPFFNDPLFRRFFGIPEQREYKQKRQGLGSGFIISRDGYIVTNNHVVNNVDKIKVKLTNGKTYSAKLVGSDQTSDLALLKIDAKNLKVVHIGDSDSVQVGDFAIAIGNPYGLSSTFTVGVISSLGREEISPDGFSRIQTDAAINPGNSGGPLLNIKGEVIGINQMIYTQSGGSVGIGFAIPINHAMDVLEKLKKGEKIKPGYIGVQIIPNPTEDQLKELNLQGKTGLLVASVELGSPAWKAGIRPYDFIIEVDGKKATKFSVLKSAVLRKGVGGKLRIKAIRDGRVKTFTVTVGEMPSNK
ncbi:MAG: PDZ domain-containing protein [Candidatus Hydrogenedentota bacterium]|nr:MAG: PDZ domain-containing protein [Candidatus Hydrogenedentota bacterium]